MPHCDHCATAPVNDYGLRRAHCATCGVLCYGDPRDFEQGAAFCSDFCADVKGMAAYSVPISEAFTDATSAHTR
jgi:hypothetical protein